MKNEKLGQEQAFPSDYTGNSDREIGISKRFYAACAAMQGLVAFNGTMGLHTVESTVGRAYEIADELLKQEIL
jgi:hypothetical protein